MAEGFLKSFDPTLSVQSAGTHPSGQVHPLAVKVMAEMGIDISENEPTNVEVFTSYSFDYVITVCDHARETCPVFTGKVTHKLHIGFDDPAEAKGTDGEILAVFKRVRDEIKEDMLKFYQENGV